MNIFKNLFKKSNQILLLGRWKINHNDNIVNRVVYLANEDHCGCCEVKYDSKDEKYYLPFCL